MKILCKTGGGPPKKLQANQQVNRVGRYLYKNIDGALKIQYTGNICDVWFTMLYEIPKANRRVGYMDEDKKLHEIVINLNITTYQNKVRVNTIEVTPTERTLGFDLFLPEQMEDLEQAKHLIYTKVCKRVAKAYKEYDFVF